MRSTSTTATVPPFNPFAGGPPSPAPASAPSTGPSPGSTQRTLSLSAATSQMQSGSSGSAAPAARTAALAAKLEALEREAPPWLLPPTRLSMQHHGDGKLVLLGAGAYARVYAGYLVPDTKDRSSSGARAGLGQPLEPLLPVAIKVGGRAGGGSAAEGGELCGGRQAALLPAPAMHTRLWLTSLGLPLPDVNAMQVMEAADVDAFLKEAGMLQRLSGCPQVVALHGACVVDQALTVVMELLEVRWWWCAGVLMVVGSASSASSAGGCPQPAGGGRAGGERSSGGVLVMVRGTALLIRRAADLQQGSIQPPPTPPACQPRRVATCAARYRAMRRRPGTPQGARLRWTSPPPWCSSTPTRSRTGGLGLGGGAGKLERGGG